MTSLKPRPTIRDVAREAEVSIATVSRVLSGSSGAGAEVRERVLRVAAELGYRGDAIARSLRSRRTDTLGLVVPDITNPFFPSLVQEIEQELQRRGSGLLLADAQSDAALEAARVRSLLDRRLDALLISPSDQERSAEIIAEAMEQVPVVQVDRWASAAAPYIGVDHDRAIRDVVAHLREGGRTRFAFVGYAAGVSTSEARLDAFIRHTASVDPSAGSRILREEPQADGAVPAAWLDSIVGEVDGLVVTSDLIAIALRDALVARGARIPEDIALVSFDDTLLASAANLSSVRQPLRQLALAGIRLVHDEHAEVPPEGFPATLVVRGSSGGTAHS
ncbi:MAG: LacI family DNA-binding transcriptional regulator [Protaetiibacter sp.]